MSADWQVGDLALCVDDSVDQECPLSELPVKRGSIYRVRGVDLDPDCFGDIGLFLDGIELRPLSSATYDWVASLRATRFRKIRPDEHEACEPEFQALLRLSKSKVRA